MAWRPLNRNDLKTKLSGSELDSVEAQLEATGDVTLNDVIGQTTDRIRGFIAAHSGNTLGAPGTLPERLIADAVAYMIPELYGHTAGLLIDLNETRVKSAERAERLFFAVSRGSYAIEMPTDVPAISEDASRASAELISSNKTKITRDDLKGL